MQHALLLVQSNQSNINYKRKAVYKSVYRENGRRQSITVVLESFPCYNHVVKKYIYIYKTPLVHHRSGDK